MDRTKCGTAKQSQARTVTVSRETFRRGPGCPVRARGSLSIGQSTALAVRKNRHVSGDPVATAAKTGPFHAVRALSAIQVGVAPQPKRARPPLERAANTIPPDLKSGRSAQSRLPSEVASRGLSHGRSDPARFSARPSTWFFRTYALPGRRFPTLDERPQIRSKIDVQSASGATRD